jgi:hypothetical protein
VPSSRNQFNVRLDAAGEQLAASLPGLIKQKLGLTVTQADMIHMALAALAEKLGHVPSLAPETPATVVRPKGK